MQMEVSEEELLTVERDTVRHADYPIDCIKRWLKKVSKKADPFAKQIRVRLRSDKPGQRTP